MECCDITGTVAGADLSVAIAAEQLSTERTIIDISADEAANRSNASPV